MGTICTNKKGVTHTPLHTFQHPHHNTYYSMTKVLCELPLPKVKLTIAFFNDDANLCRRHHWTWYSRKGKSRLLLYFVNV